MENIIFDGTSRLKLEMTSCSGNAYDITNFLLLQKVFGLYSIPSFIVVRHQMAELNRGSLFATPSPVHYREIPDPIQNRVKANQILR